jgi:allophanate hydrolase subunit 2
MSLVVVQALGLVTVQDLGRRGHMHEGLAPGGALIRSLLVATNRAAGNADGAAAIEVIGKLVVRAEAPLAVAIATVASAGRAASRGLASAGALATSQQLATPSAKPHMATPHLAPLPPATSPPATSPPATSPPATSPPATSPAATSHALEHAFHILAAGEELVVESEPARVAYVAIRGGIDASLVLDGRGTQLSAGIGARLRAGDRLRADTALAALRGDVRDAPTAAPIAAAFRGTVTVRVLPGPDLDAFAPDALAVLASAAYRVLPTSDRVGTRLDGPILPRIAATERSRPMVRGAIEVPRDGAPIVLGPEHPTTGGYPIIGVVAHDDLDVLFAVRVGGSVRFEVGQRVTRAG